MQDRPHPSTSESNSSTSPKGVVQPEAKRIECDAVVVHTTEDGRRWTIYTIGVYYTTRGRSLVFEGIVPHNYGLVRDQSDVEALGIAAGVHILRKNDEECECECEIVTDRMATIKTLLNARRRGYFKKSLRETFPVLMRYVTYELVRLLVSTNNKAIVFMIKSMLTSPRSRRAVLTG